MFRNSGWSIFVSQLLSHVALLGTLLFAAVVAPASAAEKPKVRTITAFVRLDTTQYKQQVTDTLTMLRNAKARFELAGYEVETIRISTQPFPEYTRGMSKQDILLFFHDLDSLGNFRFAAIANVPAYTPFYPASYHQGLGRQFAIALESANVVAAAMAVQRDPEATRQALVAELGMHARAIQDLASKIDQETGWTYMGLDLSPAPMKDVSIGSATAGSTGGRFGTSGTLTASATITAALRDIAVKKVGYSGLMMPVLEDTRLSQLWSEGALSMDQLLAYSAVCGTGLDTIPLPGDITADQLARIIGDVATLSAKLSKPLSARLLPVAGAKPGDRTTFDDPNLVNTVIQSLP